MRPQRVFVLAVSALFLLAACGGSDANAGSDTDDTQTSQVDTESDNGGDNSGASGGGGTVEDDARAEAVGAGADFAIAIPGGWEIDAFADLEAEGASGFSGGVQLYYSTDDFDAVVAFYDQWITDQSQEFVRSEATDVVVYSATSPLVQISVNANFEHQGGTYTFLAISAPDE